MFAIIWHFLEIKQRKKVGDFKIAKMLRSEKFFFSLFKSIFLHRALVLPADQDDPRSPETELLGRLEAQARGSAGHYHALPSQAEGDNRGTTGLTKVI